MPDNKDEIRDINQVNGNLNNEDDIGSSNEVDFGKNGEDINYIEKKDVKEDSHDTVDSEKPLEVAYCDNTQQVKKENSEIGIKNFKDLEGEFKIISFDKDSIQTDKESGVGLPGGTKVDKMKSKDGKTSNDDLPETFEELVAEKIEWVPVIKSEAEKQDENTSVEKAIKDFYKGYDEPLKYDILNDEDKETTDFDVSHGIYVYEREEPIRHWHFVTNKLSDLYELLWDGPKISGVGFEITFRLKKSEKDTQPPKWAVEFVQALSGYAYTSGNFLADGHDLLTDGIAKFKKGNNLFCGLAVVYDPDLQVIETENGKREFLQVFPITKDEHIAMKSWSNRGVIDSMTERVEKFITDDNRKCFMKDAKFSEIVKKGIAEEGSNTALIFGDKVKWVKRKKFFFISETVIMIDVDTVKMLDKVIRGRIPKGKELVVVGDGCKVTMNPSTVSFSKIDGDNLDIKVSSETFKDFLNKVSGSYKKFGVKNLKGVKFRVV